MQRNLKQNFLTSFFLYPIRSQDNGELIDCRIDELLDLIEQGYPLDQALDQMKITHVSSREKFINPSKCQLDCRNQKLIEGYIQDPRGLLPDKESNFIGAKLVNNQPQPLMFNQRAEIKMEPIYNEERPTIVGIPVIKQDPNAESENRYIGDGQYCPVINGRQYLCD